MRACEEGSILEEEDDEAQTGRIDSAASFPSADPQTSWMEDEVRRRRSSSICHGRICQHPPSHRRRRVCLQNLQDTKYQANKVYIYIYIYVKAYGVPANPFMTSARI